MSSVNFNGPIKLSTEDYYYSFRLGAVDIRGAEAVPAKPIVEPSGYTVGWLPTELGEWNGELLLDGHEFYCLNVFGVWYLETDIVHGDIFIHKMRKQGKYTRVWFEGSGELIYCG